MSILGEIRRRKVFHVAAVYGVVAWLLVQVAATIERPLSLPDWFDTAVIVLLAFGFPVALVLAWAFTLTPGGIVRDERPIRPRARVASVLLLAIATVGAGWIGYRVLARPGAPPALSTLPNSIAVLVCANLSPDPANAFFAEGLHDELLLRLSAISDLNVIARTSVLQYREAPKPIPEVARQLGVESVMECSVSYADGRVAIRAQLIDGRTGFHLWADSYYRELDDVFGIQADIARNVVSALQAEFSTAEQQAVASRPTTSAAAYALYLQARILLGGAGDLEDTLTLIDRALEIDPSFASAYGVKANILATRLVNTVVASAVPSEQRRDVERETRALAAKALALDPEERYAHAALTLVDTYTWRWSRLLDEGALSAGADQWVYAWMGRPEAAVRLGERFVALDPNDVVARVSLGVTYGYVGDHAAAVETLSRAAALSPANAFVHGLLARALFRVGDRKAAIHEARTAEELWGGTSPAGMLAGNAYVYGRLGLEAEARRLFDALQAAPDAQALGAGTWAAAYLAVGDEARALEQLEEVASKARAHEIEPGFINAMNLKMNYLDDPVLRKPKFAEVLARIHGD